jgi:hypothetical protein
MSPRRIHQPISFPHVRTVPQAHCLLLPERVHHRSIPLKNYASAPVSMNQKDLPLIPAVHSPYPIPANAKQSRSFFRTPVLVHTHLEHTDLPVPSIHRSSHTLGSFVQYPYLKKKDNSQEKHYIFLHKQSLFTTLTIQLRSLNNQTLKLNLSAIPQNTLLA